jgi:outer membrane protein OmpA-like peptidoglycan-associated protein
MKYHFAWTAALPVTLLFLGACAKEQLPPRALVQARSDYMMTERGVAMQLDPAGVREAAIALRRAENAWRSAPSDPVTTDLAIIADRKALMAQSRAQTFKAQQDAQMAMQQLQTVREEQLRQTQQALGATEMQLQQQRAATEMQQQRLQDLENDLKDARETISKIATVRSDQRGMVITVPSGLLFKTAEWTLKPASTTRLDTIATALKDKDMPIVVFGYTDSVGTRENNMVLAQKRADSVRRYLVSRGLRDDLVTTEAKGPDDPVATNDSVEGRAQNRRVEIVVEPKK